MKSKNWKETAIRALRTFGQAAVGSVQAGSLDSKFYYVVLYRRTADTVTITDSTTYNDEGVIFPLTITIAGAVLDGNTSGLGWSPGNAAFSMTGSTNKSIKSPCKFFSALREIEVPDYTLARMTYKFITDQDATYCIVYTSCDESGDKTIQTTEPGVYCAVNYGDWKLSTVFVPTGVTAAQVVI